VIKIILTVAAIGSMVSFAGLAMAQGKQGEAAGSDVSSLQAKLEAQCAHRRRTMPPDARDDCVRRLRSDAQVGFGQGDASASNSNQASAAGPGNGGGQGNGIGPGNGGGQGKGRR
jgi:hypothetical protein